VTRSEVPPQRSYARAIERRWTEALGRPVVLSPRDWERISDWHARAIPLALVLESIDRLREADGRRRGEPRGLAWLAPAVEEAWTAVVEGRRPRPEAENAPGTAVAVASWRRARGGAGVGTPLGVLLDALLAAHAAGEPPDALDRRLDRALPDAAPDDARAAVETDVDRRLAPYRHRMEPAVFERTRRQALAEGLRAYLGLSRLARPGAGDTG